MRGAEWSILVCAKKTAYLSHPDLRNETEWKKILKGWPMKFFHFDISVTNFGASGYFFRSISGPAHIQWTLPHPLQDWYSATIRRFRCILWSFISPPHEQYIYSLSLLIYRFSSSHPAIATRTLVQYRRISRGRLSLSRILLTAAARRLRSFSGVISVP